MHVLHLPPRHLRRITATAALLAVLLTALIVPSVSKLADGGGGDPAPTATPANTTAAPAVVARQQPSPFFSPLPEPLAQLRSGGAPAR